MSRLHRFRVYLVVALCCALMHVSARAATFPGDARLEVTDPTGALSWNPAANALTVQTWFKISVPSGTTINEDMTILINRKTGTASDMHAYRVFFSVTSGHVEFSTRGTGGTFTRTLVERPYLDRWYHIAVVREGEVFTAYLDGRLIFSQPSSVGNASTTDGVSVGGFGNANYFYGEVQEASIYRSALSREAIVQYMFRDQPPLSSLKGYFKFGYSTNVADNLKNFAPPPLATNTEVAVTQGSGTVEFEETNQAGEQSYFDSQKNGGLNFVVPLSGAFTVTHPILARPTPGIAFDLRFTYSSANSFGGYKLGGIDPYSAGPLGKGWRHIFETRIIPSQTFSPLADADTVGLLTWEGSIETWDADTVDDVPTGTYHTRSKAYRGELARAGAYFEWTTPERLVFVFRRPDSGDAVMRGRLVAIRDFNGNTVQVEYDETLGQITSVVDTVGGEYDFLYNDGGRLTNVTFGAWSVDMTYDDANRLSTLSKTNSSGLYAPVNTTWNFAYNSENGLLERMTDPRGNAHVSVVYDKYGRRVEQRDALGRLTRTEYDKPNRRQIRNTDAEGNAWVETYDRNHRLLSRRDPLGNETLSGYDEAGNLTMITEPLGWKTVMAYDNRANITNIVDALGNVSRRIIHLRFNKGIVEVDPLGWTNNIVIDDVTGNLLRNHDDLGSLSVYTYFTNGLAETSTDGNGHTTHFEYDNNGFLIAQTDPASNVTRFAVNELGWKLAETNALGEVTTFAYDINGKVVRTTDPLSRTTLQTYDANGNLVSATDAKGQTTTYAYDAANQRTQMVDRAGNRWRYTYTTRGKPLLTTDPLGNTVSNGYDAANRQTTVTDPLGNTVTTVYDANGKVIATIDQAGQRWSKTYDPLGRVTAETDPQGNTKTTVYDAAGRISTITTPNGYPSEHEYDGRARLAKWTDAEGYVWEYDYDGIQNITNITDALGGHYVMTYGPRNERLLEKNQDGFEWHYEYDELLRLQRQTDPNGTTRTLDYDAGGRVNSVTFNTGRVNAFQYDDNNNPEVMTRTGSGLPTITSLRYDALDRVIECTDAFNKKIRFGYDPRGLRSTLTYPDGKVLTYHYDAAGRLTNQEDWAGRHLTYEYDEVGRLLRRTYPNGVVQTNAFDVSGRLTGLGYRPTVLSSNAIAIALGYAYDRNGNKTSWTEEGTLAWPMPSLQEEKARYTSAGRLIDRQITPLDAMHSPPTELDYAYDPSGNMTNAVGGGQSWTLTYDEDNRTTAISWDCGLTSKNILNRYDAMGRRVARTMDGLETRYALDLGGKMERILCDMTPSGAVTAWYVHGPDLCYKVDAGNALTCYHADAMGNIISLTDGSSKAVAQYAYTPYGRVVGSESSVENQPYLFVGSQGVMEELPGLYFMRARYYSAEAAVFLSTDPVKKIGPGWKPQIYVYAEGNPLSMLDPDGNDAKKAKDIMSLAEDLTGYLSGRLPSPPELAGKVADALIDGSQSKIGDIPKILRKAVARQDPGKYVLDQVKGLVDYVPGVRHFKAIRGSYRVGHDIGEIVDILANRDVGGKMIDGVYIPSRKQDLLSKLGLSSNSSKGVEIRGDLAAAADRGGFVRAAKYANLRNAVQGTVGKLATSAISMAAPFIGGLAADAFGRVLPKSMPPVLREAAKMAVSMAVTAVVQAAAPYVGAAIGAAAVVAAAAVVSVVKVIVVVVVAVFGVPKPLILLLVFLCVAIVFMYWRHKPFREPALMRSVY